MSKKTTRLIGKIVLGILIVLVVLVALVLIFINPIAKNSIEKGAPLVLGTNVSVESLDIKPFKGRVEIRNLIVDNPSDSYSSEYAMKLEVVDVDIDLSTILKDKIRIEELTMKKVDIVYETNVINSNLQEILDNVKKLDSKEKSEKTEEKTEKKKSKEKTLQVDKIELEEVGVTVQAKGTEAGLPIKITIDPMGPLGEDEEGITPTGLAVRILGAIVTTAVKSAGGSVSEAAAVIGDATVDAAAGAAAAAVDAGKSAVDAVKGLFGGKKDDAEDAAKDAQPQGN